MIAYTAVRSLQQSYKNAGLSESGARFADQEV